MEVIWAILSEKSITNAATGNLTLVEVIEEINILPRDGEEIEGGDPNFLSMQLTILWARTQANVPEKGNARITLSHEADELEWKSPAHEVDLTQNLRLRGQGDLIGFPVQVVREGQLTIGIEVETLDDDSGWMSLFQLPIKINYHQEIEESGVSGQLT